MVAQESGDRRTKDRQPNFWLAVEAALVLLIVKLCPHAPDGRAESLRFALHDPRVPPRASDQPCQTRRLRVGEPGSARVLEPEPEPGQPAVQELVLRAREQRRVLSFCHLSVRDSD